MRSLTLCLLAACAPSDPVLDDTAADSSGDTGADSGADSETGVDSDTADDSDGEETGDSGEDTGGASTPLVFQVDGALDDLWLNLTPIVMVDGAPAGFEALWLAREVTRSPLTVQVPEPPDEFLAPLDPSAWPDLEAAWFFPTLHVDQDGDGNHDAGDVYTGAGLAWPVFLRGELPPELEAYGLHLGWNVLGMGGEGAVVVDPSAIPLPQALRTDEVAYVAGAYTGSVPIGEARLATISTAAARSGDFSDLYLDSPMTDPWVAVGAAAPPASHLEDISGDGLLGALEFVLGWRDGDGDGAFDPTADPVIGGACQGDLYAVLVWLEAPRTLDQCLTLAFAGIHAGWNTFGSRNDALEPLPPEDLENFEISETCAF